MKFTPFLMLFRSRALRVQKNQHKQRDYDNGNLYFPKSRPAIFADLNRQAPHLKQTRLLTVFLKINQGKFTDQQANVNRLGYNLLESIPLDINGRPRA